MVERRARLLAHGRITDGVIIDSEISENGEEIVQYSYSVHGVDFESSEILTEEQKKDQIKYAPGASVAFVLIRTIMEIPSSYRLHV